METFLTESRCNLACFVRVEQLESYSKTRWADFRFVEAGHSMKTCMILFAL